MNMNVSKLSAFTTPRVRQAGVTLVELMVAMVIGLVVAIASVATLIAARAGYSAVDSNGQVRENARFAVETIQKIVAQAGYEDQVLNRSTKKCGTFQTTTACGNRDPDVMGYNDALFTATTFPPVVTNGSRSAGCGTFADTSCLNGSDVLIVRYQGSSFPDSTAADGSMINCAGASEAAPQVPSTPENRAYAVFHVARSATTGEPALMCSYRDSTGAWVNMALVQGVETFQVLYGMDYGTGAVAANTAATGTEDSLPDRYLRADQIIVSADVAATRANWRRVRTLRIGMVVRGPAGSAANQALTGKTYYPLGERESDVAANDPGTRLLVAADGRLRQELSFTVALRDRQEIN